MKNLFIFSFDKSFFTLKKKILLLIAALLVLHSLYLSFFPDFYQGKESVIWNMKNALDTPAENYIIGDSRALSGFRPDLMEKEYLSLALPGGTPVEGYIQLRNLLEKGMKPKTLLLSYGGFHLEYSDYFHASVKYSNFETRDYISLFNCARNLDEAFWVMDGNRPLSLKTYSVQMAKFFLARYKFLWYYRAELKNSLYVTRIGENSEVFEEVDRNRGYYPVGRAEYSDELSYEAGRDFIPSKVIKRYLEDLLTMAEKEGIEVVYYATPYNRATYEALTKEYREGYKEYFNKLKEEFSEVEFHEELYFYENSLFGDSSHMNKTGAEIFTEEVQRKLQI